jgi:hypothetical protein
LNPPDGGLCGTKDEVRKEGRCKNEDERRKMRRKTDEEEGRRRKDDGGRKNDGGRKDDEGMQMGRRKDDEGMQMRRKKDERRKDGEGMGKDLCVKEEWRFTLAGGVPEEVGLPRGGRPDASQVPLRDLVFGPSAGNFQDKQMLV